MPENYQIFRWKFCPHFQSIRVFSAKIILVNFCKATWCHKPDDSVHADSPCRRTILQSVPENMQSDTVNHLFYLYFFKGTQNVTNSMQFQHMLQMSPSPSPSKRTMVPNFVFKSLYTTNRFDECRGFSCSAYEFSALPVLLFSLQLYPLKYKRALFKPLPVKKRKNAKRYCWLQNYRPTGGQPELSMTVELCRKTQQILEMSTATCGWGRMERGNSFLWNLFSWCVCCVFYSTPCMKFLRCIVNWSGFATIWYYTYTGKHKT
jgi:hypothetical protein